MKIILTFLGVFIFAGQVYAEATPVGCAARSYDCVSMPNGTTECSWGIDMGSLLSIDLQKTGDGPNYEIWQGYLEAFVRNTYKYKLSFYQRRELNKKVNYLTADLWIDGVKVTAQGENTVEARYLFEVSSKGIGIHCSADVQPAP